MMDHVCQNSSGMLLIIAHLGTTIWMREGNNIFQTSTDEFLGCFLQCLGDGIYTSNSRNDPDLIADTDFAVCTTETIEISVLCLSNRWVGRLILISKQIA